MTTMQPGDPAEATKPYAIVGTLPEGRAVAVFGLCCAERLREIPVQLAESPTIGLAVQRALDLGWKAAIGAPYDALPALLAEAIADLASIITPDGDLGRFHGFMDDSISAAVYALEAVVAGRQKCAINAAKRTREVYFQLTQEIWPNLSLEAQTTSPLVLGEVERQIRDAQTIASWGSAPVSEEIEELRVECRKESAKLVDLIVGRTGKTKADPVVAESLPGL